MTRLAMYAVLLVGMLVANVVADSTTWSNATHKCACTTSMTEPLLGGSEHLAPVGSNRFFLNVGMAVFCVLMAAMAAGLTMGLVSQDPLELSILLETNEADCATTEELEELVREKNYARNILPLVSRHHILLVTLLLLNSLANEAMPIFLDEVVPSYIAVLLSVSFVLIFGEIVPSAMFTGPQGLKYASYLSPVVYVFIALFFVVVYPIAWLLDRLFGEEDEISRYNKAKLKALIRLHTSIAPGGGETTHLLSQNHLTEDEMVMMYGAMEMKEKSVRQVMTHADKVFMLHMDDRLDINLLAEIIGSGRSRIPVFSNDRSDIRGYLVTKRLTAVDPNEARPVSTLELRQAMFIHPDLKLSQCLKEMQAESTHLAIVVDDVDAYKDEEELGVSSREKRVLGIVTVMDVIKTIINTPISDEDDSLHKVHAALQSKRPRKYRLNDSYFVSQLSRTVSSRESPNIQPSPSYVKRINASPKRKSLGKRHSHRLKQLAAKARARIAERNATLIASDVEEGHPSFDYQALE